MRYLTLAFFLALVMGVTGCGDRSGDGGEAADAGNGAAGETVMEEAPAEEAAAMDDGSDDSVPQWQVLEQNVVHYQ